MTISMVHTGKFKVALVGVGTESTRTFLTEIYYSQTVKLVAVCDENPETLKQVCESYMVNGYHTYTDLLENEEIDFVVITDPHKRHHFRVREK
jgi:predicted dehydrogenase